MIGCNHGLYAHRSDPPISHDERQNMITTVRWWCVVPGCGCGGIVLCPEEELALKRERAETRAAKAAATAAEEAAAAEAAAGEEEVPV